MNPDYLRWLQEKYPSVASTYADEQQDADTAWIREFGNAVWRAAAGIPDEPPEYLKKEQGWCAGARAKLIYEAPEARGFKPSGV